MKKYVFVLLFSLLHKLRRLSGQKDIIADLLIEWAQAFSLLILPTLMAL